MPAPMKAKGQGREGECMECGKAFALKQYYQRYCSPKCRTVAYWRRRLAGETEDQAHA